MAISLSRPAAGSFPPRQAQQSMAMDRDALSMTVSEPVAFSMRLTQDAS